jgi:hypothetical protein
MANSSAPDRPVQLFVWLGPSPAPEHPEAKVVTISPSEIAPQAVVESLRAAQLTPADLRSHVVLGIAPETPSNLAVVVYTALTTLASRRLDVVCGDRHAALTALDTQLRSLPTPPRPDALPALAQVGAPHDTLPVLEMAGSTAADHMVTLHHARRLRLVLPADPVAALTLFVAVAALRARPGLERLPMVVLGDEPADESAGFDLDTVRAGAFELRRSLRSSEAPVLAPRVELSARLKRLAAAASTPVDRTMVALGATTPDGTLWHCPRPERHRNGDANASMRIEDGAVRCFRCDPERIDSLRLVADTRHLSFDEAAEWLTENVPSHTA